MGQEVKHSKGRRVFEGSWPSPEVSPRPGPRPQPGSKRLGSGCLRLALWSRSPPREPPSQSSVLLRVLSFRFFSFLGLRSRESLRDGADLNLPGGGKRPSLLPSTTPTHKPACCPPAPRLDLWPCLPPLQCEMLAPPHGVGTLTGLTSPSPPRPGQGPVQLVLHSS